MRGSATALTTLLLLSALSLSAAPSDPLWDKAVRISGAVKEWVPGNASFRLELVDDKGAVQESWQMWYRLSPSPTGDVAMEVIRAMHNNDDTTRKEQQAQRKRKATPFTMGDNPFDPQVQDAVAVTPRGEKDTAAGRECALFDFVLKKKEGSFVRGTAWLDVQSGAPVQVSYTATPLPRGVFKLTTTIRYAPGLAGEGFLKDVHVEGVGGILFIRKSFRSDISVDGYWRRGTS